MSGRTDGWTQWLTTIPVGPMAAKGKKQRERSNDSLKLATIHDDTSIVLNMQLITPNLKRWDYSDIPRNDTNFPFIFLQNRSAHKWLTALQVENNNKQACRMPSLYCIDHSSPGYLKIHQQSFKLVNSALPGCSSSLVANYELPKIPCFLVHPPEIEGRSKKM